MLLSLRLRMFLLTICVLLVAGGMAMYFASGTIVTRFKQYLVWEQVASEERRQHLEALLPQILANHYAENGNWTDVEALVQEFSKLAEERIFLTDKTGAVIIDTTDGAPTEAAASRPKILIPILAKGQTVGAFSVLSLPVADFNLSLSASAWATRFVSAACWRRSPPCPAAIFSRTCRTSSTAVFSRGWSTIVVLHDEQVGRHDLRGRQVQSRTDHGQV